MKTTFSIQALEEAISAARHRDPAYEPGRSTSSVTTVEIDTRLAFVPKNFRKLTDEPDFKIREMATSPLILVKANGECGFGANRTDKDAIISRYEPGDLLLWAWVGQWRTDVFVLSLEDLERYYR